MLNTMRDYLAYSGLQYQKPEKAGQDAEKMLYLRVRDRKLERLLQNWLKLFKQGIQNGYCKDRVSG